jgi:hypothetical protein
MKKIALISVVALLAASTLVLAQDIWVGKDGNIKNVDARALIAGRDSYYLATRNIVYKTSDMKDDWQAVFSLPSGGNEINCLAGSRDMIFVGTQRGLFRSVDRCVSWNNVFKTIIPDKNDVLCIVIPERSGGALLIGTRKGIFSSTNSGEEWSDVSGSLKNAPVKSIALHNGSIYAGAGDGIYVRRPGQDGWERVLVHVAAGRMDEGAQAVNEEEGLADSEDVISCVVSSGSRLYIAINKKIFYSEDNAMTWQPFPGEGLGGSFICILPSRLNGKIYSATTRGVFEYSPEQNRWRELYKGKDKKFYINHMIFGNDDEKSVWAMTDEGLYRFEPGRYPFEQNFDVEKNIRDLKITYDREPPFKELQAAAMKFAEVDPEKIAKWRKEAKLKCVVPKVSVGVDNNRASNNEIYTSASKDYVVVGPDDVSNGWDVSVSWDISGLIWSDEQLSIDNRSRLTTQLRNDILDDLRRAYFERKRLQFELMNSQSADPKLRFEKELRVEELTQAIDDLTGNYLSEHIKKRAQ